MWQHTLREGILGNEPHTKCHIWQVDIQQVIIFRAS